MRAQFWDFPLPTDCTIIWSPILQGFRHALARALDTVYAAFYIDMYAVTALSFLVLSIIRLRIFLSHPGTENHTSRGQTLFCAHMLGTNAAVIGQKC